jgi:biopolymer transport protein ExbD
MSLKTRNKVDPNFNMSSLADIIFLLLIFFLITSRIVTPNALPVKRPTSNQRSNVTPVARITINDKLQYFVDGKAVAFGNLGNALMQKIKNTDKPVVILDMDKSLSIQTLVDLYDLASDLKIEMVLSTDPKKNR